MLNQALAAPTNSSDSTETDDLDTKQILPQYLPPNYDNYWVPLRENMRRTLKLLTTQARVLRQKFEAVTANSTSLEVALVDLQIQELISTIKKLEGQLQRTPAFVILPGQDNQPPTTTTTTTPLPPIYERPEPARPSLPGPLEPARPPTVNPPRPSPSTPSRLPWFGNSRPILAGYLSIDDGNEMHTSQNPGRFLTRDWFNPSFSDFLGSFYR